MVPRHGIPILSSMGESGREDEASYMDGEKRESGWKEIKEERERARETVT